MSELLLGTIPVIGVFIMTLACWLYMAGGRSGKWKRRFIGAFIASTAIWVEFLIFGLFKWLLLLLYPMTIGAWSLGYGSDKTHIKIWKRSYIVAASVLSSVGICLLFGGNCWFILPIELVVGGVSVYLGVKNPIPAAVEEFFICFFLWSPKLMYPFALV